MCDALTGEHRYRRARTHAVAGRHLDPQATAAFLDVQASEAAAAAGLAHTFSTGTLGLAASATRA